MHSFSSPLPWVPQYPTLLPGPSRKRLPWRIEFTWNPQPPPSQPRGVGGLSSDADERFENLTSLSFVCWRLCCRLSLWICSVTHLLGMFHMDTHHDIRPDSYPSQLLRRAMGEQRLRARWPDSGDMNKRASVHKCPITRTLTTQIIKYTNVCGKWKPHWLKYNRHFENLVHFVNKWLPRNVSDNYSSRLWPILTAYR